MPGPAFRVALPQALQKIVRTIRVNSPPLNFITLHYTYFIATSLISALILWGASTPPRSVGFIDALFLTTSAMTLAGLNTVNLSSLNTFQQFLLFLLIMLGSAILVSAVVVFFRKSAFERRFQHIVEEQNKNKKGTSRARSSSGSRPRGAGPEKETPYTRGRLPEVDGIVVRGSIIPRNSEDENKDAGDSNPGNHLRPELQPGNKTSTSRVSSDSQAVNSTSADEKPEDTIVSPTSPNVHFADTIHPRRHRVLSMNGVGARDDLLNHPKRAPVYDNATISQAPTRATEREEIQDPSSLQSAGLIGRNSNFSTLTMAEREKLGGVEYRALQLLEIVVPLYFVLWQLLGCLGIGAWVANNSPDVAVANGLNPWWVGAFNAVSAFNNSGMSLLDANMVAFSSAYYVLITMSILILVGNTLYPVALRFIFWTIWKLCPSSENWKDIRVALRFILDHPRRVYTNLFPSYHTWFLGGTVFVLNAVDWVAFEVLNIGNPYVESIPGNIRAIDGLFQATAVRSGGFYVVAIANIAISLQVLYVLMMYISAYPVTMTIRNSNVYEERSLGIYAPEDEHEDPGSSPEKSTRSGNGGLLGPIRRHLTNNRLYAETGSYSRSYFVRQQLRSQLSHDLWWICLAVFLITIVEGGQFAANPAVYSVFNIVFEVVSGYACVGISVGIPNQDYSFCGGWHTLSKLILCAVMLRGRHRGLPVAIDRAILLPSEHLAHAEEEDARLRSERTLDRTTLGLSRPVSRAPIRSRATTWRSEQIV